MIVPARKTYKVTTEKNLPMKTRDGVTLFADIIRPDAPGRFPVLLSRTPYNKKGTDDPNGPELPLRALWLYHHHAGLSRPLRIGR